MNPINEGIRSPITETPLPKNKKSSGILITIISAAGFVLLSLGAIIFLYNQNQALKEKLAGYQITASPTVSASTSPTPSAGLPIVTAPAAKTKIKSPLQVTGTVPTGWMNEGVFPIKLLDSDKKVITEAQGKETVPGSWQSGEPVEFTATLAFKGASGSGTLVLENDNPSGIPANLKTLEIPISF